MIIDRIQLAGIDAYFQQPNNPGQINLGGQTPFTSRTKPLGKGKQLEISAIELLIESDQDLLPLFNFQSNPLFSITVMKEMFPAFFADPFKHRTHSICGFADFKRGVLENAKAMDIDGVPTIVSIGTGLSKWTSPFYEMPEAIDINHAAWELAASRKTLADNFKYGLKLSAFDANKNLIQTKVLANNLNPTDVRKAENLNLQNVFFYQLEFSADVKKDAVIHEKHETLIGESIGTPLLRAINLLEPIESIYNIYSLRELLRLSSDYKMLEFQGQPLKKMWVVLEVPAVLAHSEYQTIFNNNPNHVNSVYEFVELAVKQPFKIVEAKLIGDELLRVVG